MRDKLMPSDLDLYFFIQFLLFYLMGFFFMTVQDGIVTVKFVTQNKEAYMYDQINYDILSEYEEDLHRQNRVLPRVNLLIFWVVSPLVTWIFVIYWWRQGFYRLRKHL